MLRVLNAVRHADVGIGLTYAQYCHDGLETLITPDVQGQHPRVANLKTGSCCFHVLKCTFSIPPQLNEI